MKKVVIIGGGFAGAKCARILQGNKNFDVTLIDNKEYFEFTPSILRVIVKPEHLEKIQIPHKKYFKGKFICGEVKEINEKYIIVEKKVRDKKERISFDYLIIASGSKYASPIKDHDVIISTRGKNLKKKSSDLKSARNILLIGGGLVSIELAAEIHSVYPEKKITIIDRHDKLLRRMSEKISQYVTSFLLKNQTEIIFNDEIESKKGKIFTTKNGVKIEADLTFLCTGVESNFEFMKKNFANSLNEKNQIKVNEFLQISNSDKTYENIFAAGDVTSIQEEKTAQSAEDQADVIIKNIIKIENKSTNLRKYESKSKIMVISLGKENGILTYKNFSLTGIIPAILKRMIEWKTMIHYRN